MHNKLWQQHPKASAVKQLNAEQKKSYESRSVYIQGIKHEIIFMN